MGHEKTWIQTVSGRKFYPLDPRAEDVDITDIAHGLSHVCRFTGHVKRFYSVAEHSIRVSRRVKSLTGDSEQALLGLLHDASEAYLCDVATPIKYQPEFDEYRKAEEHLQSVILSAFGLEGPMPKAVSIADKEMLWTEAHELLPGGPHPEWEVGKPLKLDGELGMSPGDARLRFLMDFRQLQKELKR